MARSWLDVDFVPVGFDEASTQMGRHTNAVVGDNPVGERHLERRGRNALSDRVCRKRRILPVVGQEPFGFDRQVDPRLMSESECVEVVAESLFTKFASDLDSSRVGRRDENVCNGLGRCTVVHVRDAATLSKGDSSRYIDQCVRFDDAIFERACDGDNLHDRTRVICQCDRTILANHQPVTVDAGTLPIDHGQDSTGPGMQDNPDSRRSSMLLQRLIDPMFKERLKIGVDGGAQVFARCRCLDRCGLGRCRVPVRVGKEAVFTELTGEVIGEREFEAARTGESPGGLVFVGEAHHWP